MSETPRTKDEAKLAAERDAFRQEVIDLYESLNNNDIEMAKLNNQITGLHESLDSHDEMIKQLKDERDAWKEDARRYAQNVDAAYVRGLERAKEIVGNKIGMPVVLIDALDAEIDKTRK